VAVIEFEHVTKTYQLGTGRTSLREAIPQLPRRLFGRDGARADDQQLWALKDVSFQVEQGEILGIIGPNGAGKSTILKLLSKVTSPTSGRIHTHGRMAALIELGAGFHPDLTGRENVYLNGIILGLRRQEIDTLFSDIVEFAGLERFIDTPIKRYSSGMYVRLAFAVAAHVRAELLLVDEVLSVGDMAFQQKCQAKMNELHDDGATIVFVSHNLAAVQSFCDRALLLRSGQIAASGNASDVIQAYTDLEQEARNAALAQIRAQDKEIVQSLEETTVRAVTSPMLTVKLLDLAGQAARSFAPTEGLTVRCRFTIPNEMQQPMCMVQVRRRMDGFNCFTLYFADPSRPRLQGEGTFEAHFDQLLLVPGAYTIEASIHSDVFWEEAAVGLPEPFYVTGRLRSERAGIYQPNVKWSLDLNR
jgi:ABC-type polysaccharide/polyol phosphate transport system ATPase subunit